MPYDDHGLYDGPFCWHEPTILGYWYKDILPEDLHDGLIEVFKRENPDVIKPAKEPMYVDGFPLLEPVTEINIVATDPAHGEENVSVSSSNKIMAKASLIQ